MNYINIELLSIEEVKLFNKSYLVYGYYGDKHFGLNIKDDDFSLLADDTPCTDKELSEIFKYIMNNKEMLLIAE